MNYLQSILFCISAIVLYIHQGEAIECYECNSHRDKGCDLTIPFKNHSKSCPSKSTMCRKITQVIEFEVNGLQPESRTIRYCAHDESNYKGECYQRSGFGGRQEVCSCLEDNCNGATVPSGMVAVVLSSLSLAFFTYFV